MKIPGLLLNEYIPLGKMQMSVLVISLCISIPLLRSKFSQHTPSPSPVLKTWTVLIIFFFFFLRKGLSFCPSDLCLYTLALHHF